MTANDMADLNILLRHRHLLVDALKMGLPPPFVAGADGTQGVVLPELRPELGKTPAWRESTPSDMSHPSG